MGDIPERIREEAYRLAKESIFHGGVDWAAGDIAKALAAAEQRGREMEREKRFQTTALDGMLEKEIPGFSAAIRSRSEGKGE